MTAHRYLATLAVAAVAGGLVVFASYRTAEKPAREPSTRDAVLWTPPTSPRTLP